MFARAFQADGVYCVDCRIGKGQLFCKGLFVDAPSFLGSTVIVRSVDNREFWLKVRIPESQGMRTEDYILEILDYERVPF